MLWVAAHLPQLGLEIFQRRHPRGVQQPMVLAEDGRVRLVDDRAQGAGVAVGASLATALSIAPGLTHFERDPAAEAERLRALAAMAHRFTPTVSVAPPAALLLEVAGSLNLFEGLGPLLARLRRAVGRLGHGAALAAAHTPAAALALAKAGLQARLPDFPDRAELTQRACEALVGAPIACIEIEARSIERLADMGLFEVGALIRLPRHELGKRFGPGLVETLGKLTGAVPDPRVPEPLRERFRSSMHLLESVSSKQALRLPMRRLAVELEAWLTARQLGARALRWFFKPLASRSAHHSACRAAALPVRFAQPRSRANILLEISALALDRIDLPAQVMSLSLVADTVEPIAQTGSTHRDLLGEALSPPQCGAPLMRKAQLARCDAASGRSMAVSNHSTKGAPAGRAPMDFVDRVTARLNGEAVRVLRQVDDHRPECATAFDPAILPETTQPPSPRPLASRSASHSASPFPRPMWLLESPRPVNPERYRILSGPERLETGWWEAPAAVPNGLAPSMSGRDYFIASDAEGARCWLFKFRSPNPSDEAEPWYLHGYFA
ncbi:MAG: DNA polymerase Y family protein [Gammaproteobacteria bacterium]|nr:DNA polymerase Y family protein [Gammaproteobacteria bacterium]